MKRFIAFAVFLALAGCFEEPVKFSEKRDRYIVTDVHTGKYTTVDLKNVNSGQVWLRQSISCPNPRDIKIGGLWDIYEIVYRYPESNRFTSMLAGLSSICPR